MKKEKGFFSLFKLKIILNVINFSCQVLELALNTPASGCTANAASLYPYYERKEVLKTLIMVTDEEENTNFQNFR